MGADAAQEAQDREELTRLVGRMRELPERQRRARIGQELEGRSQNDMASELGVSVGAVKCLVLRARRTLAAASVLAPMPLLHRLVEMLPRVGEGRTVTATKLATAAVLGTGAAAVGVTQVTIDPSRRYRDDLGRPATHR